MTKVDLQPLVSTGRSLSASLAAWLLAFFHDPSLWDAALRENFVQGIQAACEQAESDATTPVEPSGRKDPRMDKIKQLEVSNKEVVTIYTDYDVAKHVDLQDHRIQFTDDRENADFLLLTSQVKNFLAIPIHQRVGQFPYEGALVRKDLLPLTVRKYCYVEGKAPEWWHPYFDLRTEFHLFAQEHRRRQETGAENRWIIKPAQGTRALGHRVIADAGIEGLRHAAAVTPLLSDDLLQALVGARSTEDLAKIAKIKREIVPFDGSDRIAQLFVENPLLIGGRKFDMRYIVFVRNFFPLEAYTHQIRYGRLANKPYSVKDLGDWQVALTVCAYDEDEEIANKQERAFYTDLEKNMEEQYGPNKIDIEEMHHRTLKMLRELFTGAGKEIGTWPNSSAYYAVDLIYEGPPSGYTEKFTPQPKLLEVNFMGDWHGVESAVGDQLPLYHQWATDLYLALAYPNSNALPNDRLIRL
eukprot:gene8756-9656_t